MVFQTVYLFNDTIENNIKFGKPGATHEEVVAVARSPWCPMDFILPFRMVSDTVIRRRWSYYFRWRASTPIHRTRHVERFPDHHFG